MLHTWEIKRTAEQEAELPEKDWDGGYFEAQPTLEDEAEYEAYKAWLLTLTDAEYAAEMTSTFCPDDHADCMQ